MFSTGTIAGIAATNNEEPLPWMMTVMTATPQSHIAQPIESFAVATVADISVDATATATAAADTGNTASSATNSATSSGSRPMQTHRPEEAEAAATAATLPLDSKTTAAASAVRMYRILALSMLTLAMVFGTGFGFGVLYSKNQCQCNSSRNSSRSSSSSNFNNPFLQNPGASLCNESSDQGSSAGSKGNGSGNADDEPPPPVQQPQAEDSSIPPPIAYSASPVTMCAANDDAMNELRQAVRVYANAFINKFAYYIRKGGNDTQFADTEGSFYVNGEGSEYGQPWNALDWAMAVTAEATTTNTETTETTRRRGSVRSRQTQASAMGTTASRSQRSHQAAPASPKDDPDGDTSTFVHASSRMQRRVQSTGVGNATSTRTLVQVADTVQSYGAYVYIAHGDEIVIVQSATTAIHSRIRIPKVHSQTRVEDLLLLLVPEEDENNDNEGSTFIVVPHLVALVNEVTHGSMTDLGYDQTLFVNTTVLVYRHGVNSEQQQYAQGALTLVRRYSLPGTYRRAHAVQDKFVHVVTSIELPWDPFTNNLTPAVLQANETNGLVGDDATAIDEAPLRLNETQYRQLAAEQLERQIEAFVLEQAATWDCTGFVPLLPIRPNNTNWDVAEFTQLLYITSLEVSATTSSSTSSTISMIPPGRNYNGNMLVTDNKLVLWYQLWSGSNISLASQPLTWFIVFSLVNASVVLDEDTSSSSSMVVPGTLVDVEYTDNPVDVNHYTTQSLEEDYLRFMTTRYDNLLDFYESDDGNDYTRAARAAAVTLKLTDAIATASGSDAGAADQASSMAIGELADIVGINGTIASITYHGDYMLMVVSPVRDVMTGEIVGGGSNDASLIVYTIDTSDPSNPVIGGGGQELVLPIGVDTLYLYPIDVNWIVGIGASYVFDTYEPFQLLLLNVSNLDEQPPRVVTQWQDDTSTLFNDTKDTASTGTSSNITQAITNVAEYNDGTSMYFFPTVHYIDEGGSNMLVLPVQSTQFLTRPCVADTEFTYRQPDYETNHNSSFFNSTCRYDDKVVFDGFWIFHINLEDLDNAITKHFVIDHASPELQQQTVFCTNTISLTMRSLAFSGDVMTFKNNVILSHDVLTQVEAAPALILTPTDCNT